MDYDLLQVVLLLQHPVSLLYLVAVGGLPHVVVSHYALHRLPRQLHMCTHTCYAGVSVCVRGELGTGMTGQDCLYCILCHNYKHAST